MKRFNIVMGIIIILTLYFLTRNHSKSLPATNPDNMRGMSGMNGASETEATDDQDEIEMNHDNMDEMSATTTMDHANMPNMEHDYQTMDVEELATILIQSPDQYIVVNVDTPYKAEISGTDFNIPYNDIEALTTALPDKDTPIILYCHTSEISTQASQKLVELGYTEVWDVEGGIVAWVESGRELINTSK